MRDAIRLIFLAFLFQATLYGSSEIRTAIDIGTGKIKMQVARVDEERVETLHSQAERIPNIPIIGSDGNITQEGQASLIAILSSLKEVGERYGATKCEAIATELFRKAPNGLETANEIAQLLQMEIKVISSEEEGILGFLTIVNEARLDPDHVAVLDIGSGSFQITCKMEDRFLVYSAPFGRNPMYELVQNNALSSLQNALSAIDPLILEKIHSGRCSIVGIGAHPKQFVSAKGKYYRNDLIAALQECPETDLNYSDLLLVKTLMDFLHVTEVEYIAVRAGNTSGLFSRP